MNLFGKKKKQSINIQDTITKLNETIKLLEKREEHLDKQIKTLRTNAKKVKDENKPKCLFFLKKAKIYQNQLDTIYNTKYNIEVQLNTLSQTVINREIVDSMTIAKDTVQQYRVDVEKTEDLMENIQENIQDINEVSSVLSKPIGDIYDDDDLLKELEELETELYFPKVPENILQKQREEQELKELDAIFS
jgi:charged multivesicular body protein 4